MSTGASSVREPSVIKINASDEDGDESMADKTSEEELGKFNFYVILFSLTNAILPENALKKLGALLPMDLSRVISRSALKTVGLFIFFKCAAKHCKIKVGGVFHYQDSKDYVATSNLKTHTITMNELIKFLRHILLSI